MKIWIYERECQIGDLVFADGTVSDIDNKTKTAVGVCFYINHEDKTQRLCIALKGLTSLAWGLYSANWSGGIALSDDASYSVFDIPTLTNKTNNVTGNYINESTYRDPSTPDGFKVLPSNMAASEIGWTECEIDYKEYKKKDMLPWGLINTLKIMAHRNTILTDPNINLPLPQRNETQSELANLIQLMQDVVDSNSGAAKYREFYYPAASQCNSYEPETKDGESLSDCFKSGKWFLPSAGELARIYWVHTHNELQEASTNGIFAKHIATGVFTAIPNSVTWASSELSAANAWNMSFSSSILTSGTKTSSYVVRPICAF